jgi:serine/threonine protein kinase/tetratricopeptide (TPR) repeat protein
MTPDPDQKTPRAGPLRALASLFRKSGASPTAPGAEEPFREGAPTTIGHYRITGELGRGGMGIVYKARDPRLERTVAVKTMSAPAGDDASRQRFLREARAAASVNHPNICQIHDIGEHQGDLYIAMELLEGEPLADRLRDGPLTVAEAVPIGLGILAALSALHARGIIHRDLKPSNVFLTPHGVKLLDFGLARPIPEGFDRTGAVNITQPGMIMGTPRYIAPEQVTGEPIDGRSDLFAAGAILFEMLAGRPAFNGNTVMAILNATVNEQPPALSGSPAVAAVDRVIRRALAKRPADRYATADAMAEELRAAHGLSGEGSPSLARTLTRLVVLPFRVLRPDPETDFLAFSLPDAIATSLSGFGSLIVRSTMTAARFGGDAPDLRALAAEADVDRVVMGSLLRSGDQLRATAQLVEAPGGTLLTSYSVQASLGDLFRLQDDLARRVVDALALPLGAPVSTPDKPQNPASYAFYLEANALARSVDQLPRALDLYRRSVEIDPRFAPAWAELGRTYRVIAKFVGGPEDSYARAEEALQRALELSPRLTVAHKYYAHLEADTGHSQAALVRLLDEAARHENDPEIFAGLVHACRYCGLLEQSVAAHEEARRLDPHIATSLEQTLILNGEYEQLLSMTPESSVTSGANVAHVEVLVLMGRREEALKLLQSFETETGIAAFRGWMVFLRAWIERNVQEMVSARDGMSFLKIVEDPEALFQEGWAFCEVGHPERGLDALRRALAKGYFAADALQRNPLFDGVRGDPRFQEILAAAIAGRDQALRLFRDRRGERLLGRRAAEAVAAS